MLSFMNKLQGSPTSSWLAHLTIYGGIFMSLIRNELCNELQESMQMCRLAERAYNAEEKPASLSPWV